MMSHRILPENTTITIYAVENIFYKSCIKQELIPLEPDQRVFRCFNSSEKDQSSARKLKKNNHLDPQVQISFPNLVSKHEFLFSITIAL
jgi:hypothetical protein